MRWLALLLVFLAASAALAQTPDPTPPHLYYPLAVGNEWEYANIGSLPSGEGWYTRREIPRDSVYGGQRYFVEVTSRVDLNWNGWGRAPRARRPLRHGHGGRRPSWTEGGREFAFGPYCLDADFNVTLRCWSDPGEVPGGDTFVDGGLDAQIPLGRGPGITGEGTTDSLRVRALKVFYPANLPVDPTTIPYYAAPIGYAGESPGYCAACRRNLSFARVHLDDGTVYEVGARYTDGEDGPEAQRFALVISPNPTSGPLAVAFGLDAPAAVTAEAFDALGRRVWRHETALGAGPRRLDVDVAAWAPGLYVVRVMAGGEVATARVVRR